MALFEGYERRMPQLQPVLEKYGFKNFEEVKAFNNARGVDAYKIVEETQPICFENAKWAYELGAAIAFKEGVKTAADAARCIGRGLQAFCIPGSVADQRQVGIGHGNLGAMLLDEDNLITGYEFVNLGKMMDYMKKGDDANTAYAKAKGHYGRFDNAPKYIDPRQE